MFWSNIHFTFILIFLLNCDPCQIHDSCKGYNDIIIIIQYSTANQRLCNSVQKRKIRWIQEPIRLCLLVWLLRFSIRARRNYVHCYTKIALFLNTPHRILHLLILKKTREYLQKSPHKNAHDDDIYSMLMYAPAFDRGSNDFSARKQVVDGTTVLKVLLSIGSRHGRESTKYKLCLCLVVIGRTAANFWYSCMLICI